MESRLAEIQDQGYGMGNTLVVAARFESLARVTLYLSGQKTSGDSTMAAQLIHFHCGFLPHKYKHERNKGVARESDPEPSRIIWSSERPLSSCKQQLCLFACSTSLPAPSRVRYPLGISTSAISQTMPAAAVRVSYVRTPPQKL